MVREPADKRAINRISCRLAVSGVERSSNIGEVENLSLDGMFVSTSRPLPIGSVLPMAFVLGTQGEIRPFAEIVRHTSRGFGARFVRVTDSDARRLRRYVTEINALASHRQAADRLTRSDALFVDDAERIRKILLSALQTPKSNAFTIVPKLADMRIDAQIVESHDGHLEFSLPGMIKSLGAEAPVLVLHTHAFSSFSFESSVIEIVGGKLRLTFPNRLYYSERRGGARAIAAESAQIIVALPWHNGDSIAFPLCERSPAGLSFRVSNSDVHFWPGTPLPHVTLDEDGVKTPLANVVVKHLTAMHEADGGTWLKVGAVMGHQRAAHDFEEIRENEKSRRRYRVARHLVRNVIDKLTYVYHKRAGKLASVNKVPPFSVVRFNNARGLPLTGLLNLTFRGKGVVRGPLVLISPGFAGRKETLGPLAMTMIHNFRRNNLDFGVLRFDGTNNLGESFKDEGCEADGKHCMHFTLSGCMDDIVGAVRWASSNPFIAPSAIILISSSFSSVSARKALTAPELHGVSQWIALMGPPDAAHPIANAMGTSDPYNDFIRGIKIGVVTIFGCLLDGDRICRDMQENKLATLEDARTDMARVKADVTWLVGKHDGFIDPRRVEDVMSVKAVGKRQVITVDAGHLPRTSDEALRQFCIVTAAIQSHLKLSHSPPVRPSGGWLAALSDQEWQRVRKSRAVSDKAYWKDYLVGDGSIGYDIWRLTPEYQQLMADQTRLLNATGCDVLDVGAGTGNASAAVAMSGPTRITSFELVAEALARARDKVAPTHVPLETVVGSADGVTRTAIRRWIGGDMRTVQELLERLPARHQEALADLPAKYTQTMHGILRGSEASIAAALEAAGLSNELHPYIDDIRTLVQLERGSIDVAAAKQKLSEQLQSSDALSAGLPFADNTFQRVVCSLVLSYVRYPEDTLAEIYRVLQPGGILVISSMKPDSEGSQTYLNAIRLIQDAPVESLPPGYSRESLLNATHRFLDHASDLVRLEEEGLFRFWDGEALMALVQRSGLRDATVTESFGMPSQAVIVQCCK